MARGGGAGEAFSGAPGPVRVADRGRVSREVVGQDQLARSGAFGDPADLGDVGEQRGRPVQLGPVGAVPGQVAEVGHLVDQDVGPLSQRDQVLVQRGVAGEHHRPVGGVEPVGQRRHRPPVHHRHRGDPDRGVGDHHDRDLSPVRGPGRGGDVDAPDQRARIGHPGVERHHVQVIGVAGQDVADQVRGAGGGQVRADRGLAAEDGITGRQHVRARRAVDPDRRQRAAVGGHPDAPRVQQHTRQVTAMVDVQVGEEHRVQGAEVQSRVGERGRRPAAAVDDEHPPVDDQCRGDPAAAGHGHRRARGPEQNQFGGHAPSFRTCRGRLGRHGRSFQSGQRPAEFPARADAQLAEHLTQVPLDRPRADEQLGTNFLLRLDYIL